MASAHAIGAGLFDNNISIGGLAARTAGSITSGLGAVGTTGKLASTAVSGVAGAGGATNSTRKLLDRFKSGNDYKDSGDKK